MDVAGAVNQSELAVENSNGNNNVHALKRIVHLSLVRLLEIIACVHTLYKNRSCKSRAAKWSVCFDVHKSGVDRIINS